MPIKPPIPDHLAQVRRPDRLLPRQIGDAARHLEHPMESAGGEAEADHGRVLKMLEDLFASLCDTGVP